MQPHDKTLRFSGSKHFADIMVELDPDRVRRISIDLRKRMGITQVALSRLLAVQQATLSAYERGINVSMRPRTMAKLATQIDSWLQTLDMTPAELLLLTRPASKSMDEDSKTRRRRSKATPAVRNMIAHVALNEPDLKKRNNIIEKYGSISLEQAIALVLKSENPPED